MTQPFNALIIDFDGTIYDYESANNNALNKIFYKLSNDTGINYDRLNDKFKKIRNEIMNSNNSVLKHNKLVYFIELADYLGLSLEYGHNIFLLYQEIFFNSIELFENFIKFLSFIKSKNIKIIILSNNTLQNTIDKLTHFKILGYIDKCITSDIIGEEKPHTNIYKYLNDYLISMNLNHNNIIIGDNYKHDIEPFLNKNNILFHKCQSDLKLNGNYYEFNCYSKLTDFLEKLYQTMNEYSFLSKIFGQSIYNIQGAGGNISIKIDDILIIKSSGFCLGNTTDKTGFIAVNNIDTNFTIFGSGKPSLETCFHTFLKKYTVHLHYIPSNKIFCGNNTNLQDFKYDYLVINFELPGKKLAENIKSIYNGEEILFLKNHGLILTSHTIHTILEYIQYLNYYFHNDLPHSEITAFDINFYLWQSRKYTKIVKNIDQYIETVDIIVPDLAVFTNKMLQINNLNDIDLDNLPDILNYKNNTYILCDTLEQFYKQKEIIDGYNLLISNTQGLNDIKHLQNSIINMPEEIYRKTLI